MTLFQFGLLDHLFVPDAGFCHSGPEPCFLLFPLFADEDRALILWETGANSKKRGLGMAQLFCGFTKIGKAPGFNAFYGAPERSIIEIQG